jgi:large subunit ribosomal protein L19
MEKSVKASEWIIEGVKKKIPDFRAGDTLKVYIRIKEGDKTRTQLFEGVCVYRRGRDANATFSVVRETHGDIVEKLFPLYSPVVEKIVVAQKGKARRARLYHLRKKTT